MTDPQRNALVCSVSKLRGRLKYFGSADIKTLALLKVVFKYKEYVTNNNCAQCEEDCRIKLDKLIASLENKSKDICHIDPGFKYFPLVTEAKNESVIK